MLLAKALTTKAHLQYLRQTGQSLHAKASGTSGTSSGETKWSNKLMPMKPACGTTYKLLFERTESCCFTLFRKYKNFENVVHFFQPLKHSSTCLWNDDRSQPTGFLTRAKIAWQLIQHDDTAHSMNHFAPFLSATKKTTICIKKKKVIAYTKQRTANELNVHSSFFHSQIVSAQSPPLCFHHPSFFPKRYSPLSPHTLRVFLLSLERVGGVVRRLSHRYHCSFKY